MNTTTTRAKLNVLDGGRSLPVSRMHRILMDAYVTDTRLMGVLAVSAHWSIIPPEADRGDPDNWEELFQFFYIDCEEAGLETYQQVRGVDEADAEEADRIEDAMICGLGGRRMELNERQLRLLLQNWEAFNEEHGLPLPRGREQYGFLLEPRIDAPAAEQRDLMALICSPVRSDEQAVNYFLMRCFGRDHEGAAWLAGGKKVPLDLYDDYVCATFCRNVIRVDGTLSDGTVRYRCESLIEMDGNYEMVVSFVSVRMLAVVDIERGSRMPVSGIEAAMILRKTEFITLYEVFLSEEELEENIGEFTLGFHTTMSEYENGRLFMSFRENNDHVDSRCFLLSNDVRGMYFLTNARQLLLCAYTPADVRYLEGTIARSVLAPYLIPSGRYNFIPGKGKTATGTYEFRQPILYEFMRSDFEHFEDFLEVLRGTEL